MPKEIATLFIFESESSPGKTYQTLVYVDGSMSCECPGWKFKRKTAANGDRTCKHVRDIDAGMGGRHAIKMVEYSVPVKVDRRPQRAMQQTDLEPPQVGRVFELD